ncbi:hypothetical protein SUGI_0908710 [Cryptomeria japonica]|nr:hypothetical protein SUGI_0908710 [Cryptomeria japonica]
METMESKIRVTVKRMCAHLGPCYYFFFLSWLLFMAIHAQEEEKGFFIRSPESSMSKTLISAGYTRMADLLAHPDAVGFDLATYRNLTVFALPDHALLPILHSHTLPRTLHFHACANKLSYRELLTLRSRVRIPSLEAGRGFVIRRRRGAKNNGGTAIVTLNGHARVVLPDLYSDDSVVVHGIDRLVDVEDISKRRRQRKRDKKSRNFRKSHSSSCGFKRPGDSNARPCGSKGHLTSGPPPGDAPMQAWRPQVPSSTPRNGSNVSEMSSDQGSLLESDFERLPSRGEDHVHMDWLRHWVVKDPPLRQFL